MKKNFLLIACFAMIAVKAQNPELSKQDKKFTECAQMQGLMELKLSELAMNKGFSPEVKELAQHMMEGDKKADVLLTQIASSKSLAVKTVLDDKNLKIYNQLSDKVGEDFDKSFVKLMIKSHKHAICMYKKETKKGENTELRAFATNALPSITNHKNLAQQTCVKLKKKT